MKANQNFRRDDEAVSPVIGVILMVAITVVLAAVVFILVNDLGSSEEDAPDMGFSKDNDAGTITIVKAPSGSNILDWSDLSVGGTAACTEPASTDTVDAGDQLTGCGTGTVTVTHIASNTLLYETEFT